MTCQDRVLVVSFLEQAKTLIAQGRITFWSRSKNFATLNRLGLRTSHQLEILQELTPDDYCHSVPALQGSTEDALVFGSNVDSIEVYIKLKIQVTPAGELLICVSFHEAEFPLSYPYRMLERGGEP